MFLSTRKKTMAYCAARNDREYKTNFDSNYRIEEYEFMMRDVLTTGIVGTLMETNACCMKYFVFERRKRRTCVKNMP